MLSDSGRQATTSFQEAVRRGSELEESGQLGNRRHALFGLLMQATAGDCRMSKPPEPTAGGDEVLRWMAWRKRQGMTREAAMTAYIDQVNLIDEELSTGGAAIMESVYGSNGYYSSGELMSSSEPVFKVGTLYKQRDVFKGWRPRKFVLRDRVLSYYISDDDPTPRGQLILEGCTVCPLKVSSSSKRIDGELVGFYPFVVSHPDSTKAYYLASTSQEDTDDWIKALRASAAPARRASIRQRPAPDSGRLWRRSESLDVSGSGGGGGGGLGGFSALIPVDLLPKVTKALEALREHTGSSTEGWELAFTRTDVRVFRKPGSLSPVRGEGVIAQHPVSVLLAVLDLDRRRLYDSQLEFARRVKLYNAHTFLDYLRFRAVWPTSARDMYVTVHWQVLEDGTIVVVNFTDTDKYPEEAGCVRAECIIAGWVIRPLASSSSDGSSGGGRLGSQVSFLLQADLKGNMPTSIKNSVAESQPMLIAALRKFLKDHEQSPDYRCDLGVYSNPAVELLMDNLNRRVLATEANQPVTKRPVHQRSLSIKEIQSELPPHMDGQIEDAVQALLETEDKMDGWELFREEEDGSRAYIKESDAADLSALRVRTEGVLAHSALAVLQAITTLDFVNIWNSAIEFSTHERLHNVHTWVTYERLKAIYPMPTRDVCQLVHWRVVEDQGKLVVVGVDNDSHPEEDGYVRAHLYEGWVLTPLPGNKSCRVTSIWSVDIRGVLTDKVRTQLAQKQAAVLSSVRRFLEEYQRGSGGSQSLVALHEVELTNLAVQPLVVQWNHWSPGMLPDRIRLGDLVPRKRRASLPTGMQQQPPLPSPLGGPASGLRPPSQTEARLLDADLRLASAVGTPGLNRSVSAPIPRSTPGANGGTLASSPVVPGSGGLATANALDLPPTPLSRPPRPRGSAVKFPDDPVLQGLIATHQRKPPVPSPPHTTATTTAPPSSSIIAPAPVPSLAPAPAPSLEAPSVPPPPPLLLTSASHLLVLLAPVLLYVTADRAYRGLTFTLAVLVSLRIVILSRSPRSYASAFRGTEWGQQSIKSKVFVRCPVKLNQLKRYLAAKRKAGSKASVVHVAIRALGRALKEVPQLNGHTVLGRFFPCPSVDVSYEVRLRNREETSALIKLCSVEKRSVTDIASTLEAKTEAILHGRDAFYERRKKILSSCPALLASLLDQLFMYLGAGLGLSIPGLGVRAFPQGSCVVIVSPSVESGHHQQGSGAERMLDCDYMVEPDEDTANYLAPLVLNIGSVSTIARAVEKEQLAMVEVVNISITARLNGANLQDVRRLADRIQAYMKSPEVLDLPLLPSPPQQQAGAGGGRGSATTTPP